MWPLAFVILMTVAALSLRGTRWAARSLRASRWAYGAFIVFALLYFPASADFRLAPLTCEWKFGVALAVHSLLIEFPIEPKNLGTP